MRLTLAMDFFRRDILFIRFIISVWNTLTNPSSTLRFRIKLYRQSARVDSQINFGYSQRVRNIFGKSELSRLLKNVYSPTSPHSRWVEWGVSFAMRTPRICEARHEKRFASTSQDRSSFFLFLFRRKTFIRSQVGAEFSQYTYTSRFNEADYISERSGTLATFFS